MGGMDVSGGPGEGIGKEFKIVGPIPILPRISLGCIDLGGKGQEHLLELDTALRAVCCKKMEKHYRDFETGTNHPYYDENYMDHLHAQDEINQNPYYDYPYYSDLPFDDPNHHFIHDPYHYNDKHDWNPEYYSPQYQFPQSMKGIMQRRKDKHEIAM